MAGFKENYFENPVTESCKRNVSYLPRINSLRSAEAVCVRRWRSLSPDRHEIRQKRKWPVGGGGGGGQTVGGKNMVGLQGAPSP